MEYVSAAKLQIQVWRWRKQYLPPDIGLLAKKSIQPPGFFPHSTLLTWPTGSEHTSRFIEIEKLKPELYSPASVSLFRPLTRRPLDLTRRRPLDWVPSFSFFSPISLIISTPPSSHLKLLSHPDTHLNFFLTQTPKPPSVPNPQYQSLLPQPVSSPTLAPISSPSTPYRTLPSPITWRSLTLETLQKLFFILNEDPISLTPLSPNLSHRHSPKPLSPNLCLEPSKTLLSFKLILTQSHLFRHFVWVTSFRPSPSSLVKGDDMHRTKAGSSSHLLFQGDDMHRTKAFPQSTGAFLVIVFGWIML
ncbi:uncharacterized protein LOC122282405 [Carya illinoinensis]|uniref:uncharacterized protein LOC122282405 n=1 Tax=Carya illinoinensis TaxID=32201 RepID=UPI001C71C821|nr:uncharacterized protein LOC122282405 [Carya illinoinensis]